MASKSCFQNKVVYNCFVENKITKTVFDNNLNQAIYKEKFSGQDRLARVTPPTL